MKIKDSHDLKFELENWSFSKKVLSDDKYLSETV